MSPLNFTHILTQAVDELSESESYKGLFHQHKDGEPLPSAKVLYEIIELSRSILFPGYYGNSTINSRTINYHIGVNIEKLFDLLCEQILAGLCFSTSIAYNGDPAAESYGEVIFCYPAIKAISNYRIAHELLELGVPLIPRIITEMAHSETGIDIHPAAKIGTHFTIDHGTGVVIGATSIIGNNVKLYQGVTLGAKSFPLDADGKPIKGIPRHPILEDNVIVYSNATILGRITIGSDATVGGNIWVTENVPAGARIVQTKAKK
mgnify:CR=1 FL=1